MTYGLARATTSPELVLYRTPGKKSRFFAAIHKPRIIYQARVNQVLTSWDGILGIVFDGGTGTLANVKADMIMFVGTVALGRDVGFVRVRSTDATHIYFDQYSGIKILDNQYLTIVDAFPLLQRHIAIVSDIVYMDGTIAYSDQHALPDPTPIMGSHRIVKMTGASVAVTFDFSQSYMINGTAISSKVTTVPTALSVTSGTTYSPVVTFDAVGWHAVYLSLTGANGKTFFGVRYVYVYNDANLPPRVKVSNISGDVNSGGWQFEMELYRNADVADVYEGALVILFSEDYYGATQSDICVVPGSEKIEAVGWITSPESMQINPERGAVHFTVQGPQWWMSKIASYPDGVRFKISAPSDWTEFQTLTIDKGVWHFLHWRTTATRILDFFPSGDARYSPEVSSLAENLWAQLQEMTALQILARPGFNALGQLFIQVHPNLIPTASRTYPTVMDIQKSDWIDSLDFDRVTMNEIAQINMSGIAIDSGNNALSYFALAPGHTYDHYGTPDVLDKLLLSGQEQVTTLAGLYFSWRNSQFPSIPINIKANVRLIDIFPNQKCTTTIAAGDNVRGIAYSGGLIPVSIAVNFDDETGRVTREVEFEAQTSESLSVREEIPGSGDLSVLPDLSYPPLPPFSVSLPGTGGITPLDPKSVLIHDTTAGLLRCDNFNAAPNAQEWYAVNGGLTTTQYQKINKILLCPNGALYVGYLTHGGAGAVDSFLARAAYAGAAFAILETYTTISAKYSGSTDNLGVMAVAHNPLLAESVYYILTRGGTDLKTYIGSGITFPAGATITLSSNNGLGLSYGMGYWMLTGGGDRLLITSNGATVFDTDTAVVPFNINEHVRVGTSGITYHWTFSDNLYSATDNMATVSGVLQTVFRGVIAMDYTGALLLSYTVGGSARKSSDSGGSFSNIGTLPSPQAYFAADYVGGSDSGSCWIAVSNGGYIYYTDDFFAGSPIDKRGNILDITATPHLDLVKVLVRA